MVLPASAADAGAAEAPAWLAKLVRQLERSQRGVLVALTEAVPTQLGAVVRALSLRSPWDEGDGLLEVCLHAHELLRVAPGSRVLLRVRSDELEWLNLHRPIFADRELRAVLWIDRPTLGALVRSAIDLFDWVSRVVPVPERPLPEFAAENVRRALALGDPFCWTGEGLFEVLRAAGCEEWVEVDAAGPLAVLYESLMSPRLAIVSGLMSERDAWRVRMTRALLQREGAWVAREPGAELVGMWRFGVSMADWDAATRRLAEAGWARPSLLAAWLDLEPEAIDWFAAHPGSGLDAWELDEVVLATGPAWMLRRHGRDEAIAVARAVRSGDLQEPPQDAAAQVLWARGRGQSELECSGAIEARLVRALRSLPDESRILELTHALEAVGFYDVALMARLYLGFVSDSVIDDMVARGYTAIATKLVERLLEFTKSDPAQAVGRRQLGELYAVRGQFRRAIEQLERSLSLVRAPANSPSELAKVLETLGGLELDYGALDRAREHCRRLLWLRREQLATNPSSREVAVKLVSAIALEGELAVAMGDYGRARERIEDALARLAALGGVDSADELWALLHLRRLLADLYEREGDLDRARRELEANVRALEEAGSERSHDVSVQFAECEPLLRMGRICAELKELDLASAHLERSESAARSWMARDPDARIAERKLVRILQERARVHWLRGEVAEARHGLEFTLALARALCSYDPEEFAAAWLVATCLERLGRFYRSLGDLDLAHRRSEQALEILQSINERQPGRFDLEFDHAATLKQLGEVDRALTRIEDAKRHHEAALAILNHLHQRAPSDVKVAHELAAVLATLGYLGDDPDLRERALELLEGLQARGVLRASDEPLLATLRAESALRSGA